MPLWGGLCRLADKTAEDDRGFQRLTFFVFPQAGHLYHRMVFRVLETRIDAPQSSQSGGASGFRGSSAMLGSSSESSMSADAGCFASISRNENNSPQNPHLVLPRRPNQDFGFGRDKMRESRHPQRGHSGPSAGVKRIVKRASFPSLAERTSRRLSEYFRHPQICRRPRSII